MSTHLVTGRAGRPHVSAEDIGAKDSGIFGAENYVLETGNQFACVIINNNLIRIKDGDLIMQGRHVRVEGYEEVVIENGQLAVKRQDLIVMRYEMDANTGLETAYFAVIKGTSGNEPEEPEYERGSISEGDIIVDFPLYKILLEGTNITSIETLFSVLMPMAKYQEQVMAMEKVIEDQQKELTELNGNMEVLEKRAYLKPSTGTAAYEGLGTTVSGIHLNTVTVPGLYFCAATDGRPVSSDGFMLVMSHTNGARTMQIYFPYIGGEYKRFKTSDSWGGWVQTSSV